MMINSPLGCSRKYERICHSEWPKQGTYARWASVQRWPSFYRATVQASLETETLPEQHEKYIGVGDGVYGSLLPGTKGWRFQGSIKRRSRRSCPCRHDRLYARTEFPGVGRSLHLHGHAAQRNTQAQGILTDEPPIQGPTGQSGNPAGILYYR